MQMLPHNGSPHKASSAAAALAWPLPLEDSALGTFALGTLHTWSNLTLVVQEIYSKVAH